MAKVKVRNVGSGIWALVCGRYAIAVDTKFDNVWLFIDGLVVPIMRWGI